jgi:type II secretory pathway pseudopilin PulG
MKKRVGGFVLIELVVVFGMMAVLIGLTSMNIFGANRKATLTGTIDTLAADITSQQTKAMSSVSQNGVVPLGYGIRFDTNKYTLFQGLVYTPANTSNIVIPLDSRVTFSFISLPDNAVAFASQSGEIAGFNPVQNTFSLHQTDSGETKTIQVNRYGVITSIN